MSNKANPSTVGPALFREEKHLAAIMPFSKGFRYEGTGEMESCQVKTNNLASVKC